MSFSDSSGSCGYAQKVTIWNGVLRSTVFRHQMRTPRTPLQRPANGMHDGMNEDARCVCQS